MDLYVIRHAEAVPLGERGITEDEDRPLTEKGEEQVKALASALQRQGVHLTLIVTSPLVRARQTAEGILRQWSQPAPELLVCPELAPGGKPKRLARFLRQQVEEGKAQLAIVGHEPDLSQVAAWLIGSKKAQVDLAKGGVAYIVCDGAPDKGSGTLTWLVTREWLGEGADGWRRDKG